MGIIGKKSENHEFYCVHCGRKALPICYPGKMRGAGKLNKLFCFFCGGGTNHVECVPYSIYSREVFRQEYDDGNFGCGGQRILPFTKWKTKHDHEEELICADEWVDIHQLREAN